MEVAIRKKNIVLDLVRVAYQAASKKKAIDPLILDLRKKASYADYLLIVSATNTRQTRAIANHIEETIHKKLKKFPLGIEGEENGLWILMDYGDIVCHVFLDEVRDFYRLEHLWHDAKRVNLKQKKKIKKRKST